MAPDPVNEITCTGHQELRDIVIETRNDVKHILKALEKGDQRMDTMDTEITTLKGKEEARSAESRTTARDAGIVATVISIAIGVVGFVWRG